MTTGAILAIVFASLYAVCEVLANVPSIQANSVFQLIMNILKSLAGKGTPNP